MPEPPFPIDHVYQIDVWGCKPVNLVTAMCVVTGMFQCHLDA